MVKATSFAVVTQLVVTRPKRGLVIDKRAIRQNEGDISFSKVYTFANRLRL